MMSVLTLEIVFEDYASCVRTGLVETVKTVVSPHKITLPGRSFCRHNISGEPEHILFAPRRMVPTARKNIFFAHDAR